MKWDAAINTDQDVVIVIYMESLLTDEVLLWSINDNVRTLQQTVPNTVNYRRYRCFAIYLQPAISCIASMLHADCSARLCIIHYCHRVCMHNWEQSYFEVYKQRSPPTSLHVPAARYAHRLLCLNLSPIASFQEESRMNKLCSPLSSTAL